jgi:ubiquinone/menaquinone biosynthesis C-methylase UbiE
MFVLKELQRVLKPNGELLIGDWGKAKSTAHAHCILFCTTIRWFQNN